MTPGILIVDKPAGLTSHDVVAAARRVLGERRIGHCGTLDPLATGVLALAIGSATRLVQFLAGEEKAYEARQALEQASATPTPAPTRPRRSACTPPAHCADCSPSAVFACSAR